MKASIYRLRERGLKLPRPKDPVDGELVLGLIERGERLRLKARLLSDGREILPPLIDAVVVKITGNGVVIRGWEMQSRSPGSSKAKVTSHPQTWWALVHTEGYLLSHESLDPLGEMEDHPFAAVCGGARAHQREGGQLS